MPSWTTDRSAFHTFLLMAQLEPESIRRRIREARREKDLTQQELADLIDRHKRTIENYERVRVPEWKELVKIAAVLDRPVEWFLYGDREEEPALLEQLASIDQRLAAIEAKLNWVPADPAAAARAGAALAAEAQARLAAGEERTRSTRETG